ncbi:MAG: acetyl-coenzyme A synthetase N-terminal domain-containing protein, partial [Thermoprotei archaeon]
MSLKGLGETELPFEEKIINDKWRSKFTPVDAYHKFHAQTVENLEAFWEGVAKELEWFKPWDKVLDASNPPFYKWFVGGRLNLSYLPE